MYGPADEEKWVGSELVRVCQFRKADRRALVTLGNLVYKLGRLKSETAGKLAMVVSGVVAGWSRDLDVSRLVEEECEALGKSADALESAELSTHVPLLVVRCAEADSLEAGINFWLGPEATASKDAPIEEQIKGLKSVEPVRQLNGFLRAFDGELKDWLLPVAPLGLELTRGELDCPTRSCLVSLGELATYEPSIYCWKQHVVAVSLLADLMDLRDLQGGQVKNIGQDELGYLVHRLMRLTVTEAFLRSLPKQVIFSYLSIRYWELRQCNGALQPWAQAMYEEIVVPQLM